MEQIVLKADINECTLVGWRLNTGEVNARVLNVEMCEYLSGCERQFVTFELANGTVYESLVVGGMAKIPYIEKPQFVKIGLYAENINGDECEKRYSARPANVYVNMGSYTDDSIDPPIPTPGDYSVLLEKFEENKEEVNTALAALEKGTIPTMDKVNVWELEAGAYYVNRIVFYATPNPPLYPNMVNMQSEKGLLYIHVDISNNNSRDFYLFANGNIYFGTSMSTGIENEAVGSISSVVAAIKNEITSENVDGIPTKKAVYNYGENIKTELLTHIGERADKTEVDTALSEKVNKSDVLSNIDKNAQPEDIYNAPVVNTALAEIEKGTIKLITEEVRLLDLETGLYNVKGGKVLWDEENMAMCGVFDGILYVVHDMYLIKMSAIGEVFVNGAASTSAFVECHKENDKWKVYQVSTAPVSRLFESETEHIPTVSAVIDYVEALKTEIMGGLDEISALVGSQTALPPISDDAPIYGGDTRPPIAETEVSE